MSKTYIILAVATIVATALLFAAGRRSHVHGIDSEVVVVVTDTVPEVSKSSKAPTVKELKQRSDYHKYLWSTAEINGSKVFRIDKTIDVSRK